MSVLAAHRHLACEELPRRVDCWSVARSLEREPYLFLLDSSHASTGLGRHSILAWNPRWELIAKGGTVRSGPPGAAEPVAGDALAELERLMEAFSRPLTGGEQSPLVPPAFTGGAIGFFAYELLHEIEVVTRNAAPDLGVADCHLLFCDSALVTDELQGRSWIVGNGWGTGEAQSRADAAARLDEVRAACTQAPPARGRLRPLDATSVGSLREDDLQRHGVEALTDPQRYRDLVGSARERIFAGDVYELCLTQRFDTAFDGQGIDLYAAMRGVSPAPMSAYMRFPELEVLSCSPERFLRVDTQRWVETRPIKGTRPRGRSALQDRALALDLATSAKDRAENVMIVDLARNDLGRVCDFGTVNVPAMAVVERYSSVFQLVSTIRGRLREGTTPVQLLRAAFPAGSMTGAPKIEAMRLINELEDSRRGVFAGALGYVNYSGELDLGVAIRTVVKRGDALSFHAGGAVTCDSVPAEEYQETLDKVCALVRAIELARDPLASAPARRALLREGPHPLTHVG